MSPGILPSHPLPKPDQTSRPTRAIIKPMINNILPGSFMIFLPTGTRHRPPERADSCNASRLSSGSKADIAPGDFLFPARCTDTAIVERSRQLQSVSRFPKEVRKVPNSNFAYFFVVDG